MTVPTTDVPALSLRGVTKKYGALVAVDDVSLDVAKGGRHALIGPNGAGKSTLFNLVAGGLPVTSGQVLLAGEDVTRRSAAWRARRGLGKTFQHSSLFLSMNPLDNVALAAQRVAGKGMSWLTSSHRRNSEIDDLAEQCVADVGLADRSHIMTGNLSHGERRQLEVAVALATRPQLLLLDEPAAGMSPAESQRFAELVHSLPDDLTVVIIEHDLELVFRLADRVSVLHLGALIADGPADEVREDPTVQQAYLGEDSLEELFHEAPTTEEAAR
ncbi:ABC transporter ATP-binding protein [Janibacter terrae]|jgi:branched-chain amino acid transport system ATP-binding protein|uniref:ABC transporter ATP-binding protein n=1 Tax=Janibacter terrae TaxID=103817 RepID=UPI0008391BC0|nr:ABC transporter ATP-binding protein [Janibacter terrae]